MTGEHNNRTVSPQLSLGQQTADAAAPILGRVFEVRVAEELAMTAALNADGERIPWPSADCPTSSEEPCVAGLADEPILPFLGSILDHVPSESITIQRDLDLGEDLYLADHAFVYAPGIKPVSACLPVLPMTVSLEVMAEVAACLAPNLGLLGFEEVKAARWIELADRDRVTLHIRAKVDCYDPERGAYFINASIYIEGQASPAISATVLFGERYLVELCPVFTELDDRHARWLAAEEIYAERHMFHGPCFQCLAGEIIIGGSGIVGEFVVRSPEAMFRATRHPQLLTDPALLDAIGQIIGVWAIEQDRYAFPIGLGKLEIYCPTPPIGTRAPVRVEITRAEGKTIHADVEIQNGAGSVWMRIADWRSWKFRWEQRLVNFRRLPHRFLLGLPAPLPGLEEGAVCMKISTADLGNFDAGMLARYCLSMEEMSTYQGHDRFPERQRQWLLGRVVAKDAARLWAAQHAQAEMLHPAAFTIDNDERGRPFIKALSNSQTPHVSIAHCEARAVAIAHAESVGVDIERIAERDDSFVQAFTTRKERGLIDALPIGERQKWITRVWCAKEAVGKLLGVGVSKPQELEAVRVETDGRIHIYHHASARSFHVNTVEDVGFIIACAFWSRSAFPTSSVRDDV